MRILLISHGIYPLDPAAGVELFTSEAAQFLSAEHEITVLVFEHNRSTQKSIISQQILGKISVICVPGSKNQDPDLNFTTTHFCELLQSIQPDLIYILSPYRLPFRLMDEADRLKIPWILHLHDFYLMCPRIRLMHRNGRLCAGPRRWRCTRCLKKVTRPTSFFTFAAKFSSRQISARAIIEKACAVLCVSHDVARRYAKFGLASKQVIIVSPSWRQQICLKPKGQVKGVLRIGFLGGSSSEKGIHILANALTCLQCAWHLAIYGIQGDEKARVIRLFKGWEDRITLNGPFVPEMIDTICSNLDVLVVPSIWPETYGRVVDEAITRGVIVIASQIGGMSERLIDGFNGFVFPPGDSVTLAKKITYIFEHIEELRGSINFNFMQQHKDDYAEKLLNICTSIVENRLRLRSETILPKISVVSCVNDFDKYNCCVGSSFQQEQRDGTVELLPIDNTSNNLSAPAALNLGIAKADNNIIVCCHQDVIFPEKWTTSLFEQIDIIERTNKNWGVLGIFGIAKNGMRAGHVIDSCGHYYNLPLPAEVQSLDELCLIIRKDSRLRFDEELGGFHLYGADICLEAMAKGLTNFAIDACVEHLSPGALNADFYEAMNRLYRKWKNRNPPLPVIETTCTRCRLQGGLKSILAYRIYRFKKKQRRKKVKKLLKMGADYRTLRHDVIGASYKITLSKMQIKTCDMRLSEKPAGYFESDRSDMLKYVPPTAKRVLEFGCGFGRFSALVKEKLGAETWAVEIDQTAAQEASKKLDKVINADAIAALKDMPDNYFDCVIFLDVLDHMVDPYSLLCAVKAKLTREGVIVASIPNIRYYRTFVDFILHGNWDYTDQDILDKTHLRFFTYKSILKTFEILGFEILLIEGMRPTSSRTFRALNAIFFNTFADVRYLRFACVAKPNG